MCVVQSPAVTAAVVFIGGFINFAWYTCCCRFVYRDAHWDSWVDVAHDGTHSPGYNFA